ncbi:hypothetical protein HK102_008287 [Quaeritorhiza haematococci]|nr:hypothetical protein HK102_008287 [Quaeritorhiza haematococci]
MGTSIGLLPQNLGISEPPLLSSLCDSGSKSSSQYPLVNVQSFGHSNYRLFSSMPVISAPVINNDTRCPVIRNGIEDFVAGYDRTKPMNTKPVMDPTRSSSTTCQLCGHNISEDQQMYTLDQRTRICSGCKKKECFANPLAFECKSCGIYTLIPHNEGKETVWACNTHLCLAFREFTRFVPATEIASEIQKMIRRVLQWAAEPATNMDGYRDNAIQSKIRDILDRLMLRSAFASLAFHPAICLGCHVLQLVSADAGVDPGDIPCNNCDNTLTLKLLTLDPMTPMQIFLPSEHTPPIRSGYGSDVGSSRRQVSDANTPYSFGVPLRPSEERQCDGRFDERYLALFNSLEQLFLPPELHNPTTLRKSVLFTATKEGTSKTILHSIKDPKARSDSGPTVADFERLKAINRMVFEILRGIDLELNTDRALLNEPEDLKRRLIRGFYLRNGFIKEWKDQINSYIDRRHKIVPENQLVLPDQARAFFPLQIYPYRPCGMSFVLNIEYLKKLEEVTLVFKSDILSGQAEVVPFVKARLIDGGTTLQWTFTQPSGEEEIQTTKLEGAEMFRYHVSISFDKGSRHVEVEGMPRLHFVHKGDPLILRFRLWSGFDKAQVDSELYLSDKKALYLADVKRDREQVTNSDLSKVLGEHDLGACKH